MDSDIGYNLKARGVAADIISDKLELSLQTLWFVQNLKVFSWLCFPEDFFSKSVWKYLLFSNPKLMQPDFDRTILRSWRSFKKVRYKFFRQIIE